MRALRYYGPFDLRLDHAVPEPKLLPHQVKIRPSFCGICGSDLHAYSTPTAIPFKETPHPITGETWPIILGHEFSGDVVEVGSEVENELQVGHRVAVQPTICCDACPPCEEGFRNCCDSMGFLGLMGWGGGMSDLVCVDARFAYKLPDNIPSDIGALVEPLAVAWHAVEQANPKPGDTALVMGAGPIGLAVIQCLRARDVKQVIAVEVSPKRRELARNFGATRVLDPKDDDIVSTCKTICCGQGPDFALDCAGVASSIETACLAIRHRGLVVNVAIWERAVPFNFNNVLLGEKTLSTALSYNMEDFNSVINALGDGLLDVKGMITRKITIDRVVEDGISALIGEKDTHVKILVDVRS